MSKSVFSRLYVLEKGPGGKKKIHIQHFKDTKSNQISWSWQKSKLRLNLTGFPPGSFKDEENPFI